ncbi:melatonin receptor type 1B-B-like [Tubulanus polymorphus]|uniref:melatonin receptor type 1B-B-like n=1 Tax=Tubulanus polymorphus TaxID=672921 RepID=UPI003DA2E336
MELMMRYAELPSVFHPVTNDTELITSDFVKDYPHIAVPYIVVIIAASIGGTLGNILVIGGVLSNKALKTVGNYFILNLAFADSCVSGFVDPFSTIGILQGEFFFYDKPWLCEFIASLCLTSCFCSLLSIGAISFNRYIHICHNHRYDNIYTPRNGKLMCAILWVVCFLLEFPCFVGWGDHVYDRKTLSCVWDRTANFSYTLMFSCLGVALPVFTISICYIKIYIHVTRSKAKIRATSGEAEMSPKERNESIRLARTLFVIFIVFVTCWMPYAVIVSADRYDTWRREIHIFSILLAHSNSSLNCIIYGATNRQFRVGYVKFLHLGRFFPNLIKGVQQPAENRQQQTFDTGVEHGTGGHPTNNHINVIRVRDFSSIEESAVDKEHMKTEDIKEFADSSINQIDGRNVRCYSSIETSTENQSTIQSKKNPELDDHSKHQNVHFIHVRNYSSI